MLGAGSEHWIFLALLALQWVFYFFNFFFFNFFFKVMESFDFGFRIESS